VVEEGGAGDPAVADALDPRAGVAGLLPGEQVSRRAGGGVVIDQHRDARRPPRRTGRGPPGKGVDIESLASVDTHVRIHTYASLHQV